MFSNVRTTAPPIPSDNLSRIYYLIRLPCARHQSFCMRTHSWTWYGYSDSCNAPSLLSASRRPASRSSLDSSLYTPASSAVTLRQRLVNWRSRIFAQGQVIDGANHTIGIPPHPHRCQIIGSQFHGEISPCAIPSGPGCIPMNGSRKPFQSYCITFCCGLLLI